MRSRLIQPRIVNVDWIEQSWKEKTLLDEESMCRYVVERLDLADKARIRAVLMMSCNHGGLVRGGMHQHLASKS